MVLLTGISVLHAQPQASKWLIDKNVCLDFNGGSPPKVLLEGQMRTLEGTSSISDEKGNLLFYTDGVSVWNRNHQLMPNGKGLKGHFSSTQSALIVPKPGDKSIYYLFTTDEAGYVDLPNDGACYSVVSMCLEGGLGDVIPATKNTLLLQPATEKLTATRHQNGTDYWVLIHEQGSSRFLAYLVTNQGVSKQPVVSEAGLPLDPTNYDPVTLGIGEMKLSPDGKRVGVCTSSWHDDTVQLFDFDNATGKVSQPVLLSPHGPYAVGPYSLEFSPDSKRLYVTSGLMWMQFNLRGTPEEMIQSRQQRDIYKPLGFAGIQIAPDDKIYVASYLFSRDTSYIMSVIHNPNASFDECDLEYGAIKVKNPIRGLTLPNFERSLFSPIPSINHNLGCAGGPVSFSLVAHRAVQSASWSFGDPASGDQNAAAGLAANHQFTTAGTYTVSAQIEMADGAQHTVNARVTIPPPAPIIVSRDTVLCAGQQLQLDVSKAGESCVWQDGTTGPYYTIATGGLYWVEICHNGCMERDSMDVQYVEPAALNLGKERVLCNGKPIQLDASTPYGKYLWNDGSQEAVLRVSSPGEYWVEVTTPCGLFTDTVQVKYVDAPEVDLGPDTLLCVGEVLKLNAFHRFGEQYLWEDGSTGARREISSEGVYAVEVTGGRCVARDTIRVGFAECEDHLFIPNVITPNGDGANDRFVIQGILSNTWKLEIYNRYGKIVYWNEGYDNSWDGQGASSGLYFYHLSNTHARRKYRGWLHILP